MANFELAIPYIMAHEGTDTKFWVDNKNDSGGETVWGWSMLTIRSLGLKPKDLGLDIPEFVPGCLKTVSKDVCIQLYKKHFWDKYGYDRINNQNLATKAFDISVNCGPKRAHQMLQMAATATGEQTDVDGILGDNSIKAINNCPPAIMSHMVCCQWGYYLGLVIANPKNSEFLDNWWSRARWVG